MPKGYKIKFVQSIDFMIVINQPNKVGRSGRCLLNNLQPTQTKRIPKGGAYTRTHPFQADWQMGGHEGYVSRTFLQSGGAALPQNFFEIIDGVFDTRL